MARLSVWMPATALMVLSLVFTIMAGAAPSDPRLVAAVFPPWWAASSAVAAAAAAGDVVASGNLPFVIVVRSDDDDLATRIRRQGALLVLDRSPFGLCIS